MKRITTLLSVMALAISLVLVASPMPVFAHDDDDDNDDDNEQITSPEISAIEAQIRALLAQVDELKKKLEELRKARKEVREEVKDVREELREMCKLRLQLRRGLSGDEVKTLQEILAANPDLYPEGIVSGYYGELTERAIKRFQKRYGLEDVGEVGPKTRARLEELLIQGINNAGGTVSGFIIVPGICRLPIVIVLPPVVGDKIAPVITGVAATGTTPTTTRIVWTTDEISSSRVTYSTTTPVPRSANSLTTTTISTDHSFPLRNLTPGSTYYFFVTSVDASGNTAKSSEYSFTTPTTPVPDTAAPTISNVSATSTATTSSIILWTTNESATGKVYYGTTTPLATSTALSTSSSALVIDHSLTLTGLTGSTTYYFLVSSTDGVGNTGNSSQSSLTTTP